MDTTPEYVIEMLHITKVFPGIKANDDITLQLKKGEIHALLGENGAGKSTLAVFFSRKPSFVSSAPRMMLSSTVNTSMSLKCWCTMPM